MTATAAMAFAKRPQMHTMTETHGMRLLKQGLWGYWLTCIWLIHVPIQHCSPYLVPAVFFPLNHKSDITGLTSAGVDGSHDSVKGLAISIDQNLGSPVILLGPGATSCRCCFCIHLHRQQTTTDLSKISPCCFCIYLHRQNPQLYSARWHLGEPPMFAVHDLLTRACYANDIH